MQIILYKTKSPTNTVGKALTDGMKLDECKFKSTSSIINPTLEIAHVDGISNFNYVYIRDFARYYFIRDIVVQPQRYYTLTLECDVLESFKDDILSGQAYITKENTYNKYFDSDYSAEVRTESDIYESNNSVPVTNNEQFLLVTIGGK